MTKEEKLIFLKEVKKILDENDIKFWIDAGTLLGAIRDNDFIEWDKDIDISTMEKNKNKIADLKNEFNKIGKFGAHIRENDYLASHYILKGDFKIDIYYWKDIGNEYICYANREFISVISPEYFKKLKKIRFKDIEIPVPDNTIEYLKEHYGESWIIPDKNWQENRKRFFKPLKDYVQYLK